MEFCQNDDFVMRKLKSANDCTITKFSFKIVMSHKLLVFEIMNEKQLYFIINFKFRSSQGIWHLVPDACACPHTIHNVHHFSQSDIFKNNIETSLVFIHNFKNE